jgi:Tyrosine-protein kinase ephrin type A/B receptor-like
VTKIRGTLCDDYSSKNLYDWTGTCAKLCTTPTNMLSVLVSGALLLCVFICRTEVCSAICSNTWTDFEFDGVGGTYYLVDGSCITSPHMFIYGEITDGVFDEFRLYIHSSYRLEAITFYGNVSYQRQATAIIETEKFLEGFAMVAWCTDGPGDYGPCQVQKAILTLTDCQSCSRGKRGYGECSNNDTPPVDTVCIVECPPANGSVMTSDGKCQLCPRGHYKMDSSECLPCPAGTYYDEFGASECKPCPKGTFGANEGAGRATCAGLCPAGTYSDLEGSIACKPCPTPELSIISGPISLGMTRPEECGSFATSGFWYAVGQGSIAGNNKWSTTLSEGVRTAQDNATLRDLVALREDIRLAISQGTRLETRSNEGWSMNALTLSTDSTVAARYIDEFAADVFPGDFSSYAISYGATNILSAAVLSSVVNYSVALCELECEPLVPFVSAYGWRWIHLVYSNESDDLILAVETCETDCIYGPDQSPMCPPGRCADLNCTTCFPGSFFDPVVDSIASNTSSKPKDESDAPTSASVTAKGEFGIPTTTSVTAKGESGMSIVAIVGAVGGALVGLGLVALLVAAWRHKLAESVRAKQTVITATAVPAEIPPPVVASTVVVAALDVLQPAYSNLTDGTGPTYKDQARSAATSGSGPVAVYSNMTEDTGPTYKDQARPFSASDIERNRVRRPVDAPVQGFRKDEE